MLRRPCMFYENHSVPRHVTERKMSNYIAKQMLFITYVFLRFLLVMKKFDYDNEIYISVKYIYLINYKKVK